MYMANGRKSSNFLKSNEVAQNFQKCKEILIRRLVDTSGPLADKQQKMCEH